MSCSSGYIDFVCECVASSQVGAVRHRKMFGEYMIYINDKPVLLVCDDTAYVKKLDVLGELMECAELGVPYKGAKEHYILDVENNDLCDAVLEILERVTPLPKPKKKKVKAQ